MLLWLRYDLRLGDQPALSYAAQQKKAVLMVFIYNPDNPHYVGVHSRQWLRQSLQALHEDLRARGSSLVVHIKASLSEELRCRLLRLTILKNLETIQRSLRKNPVLDPFGDKRTV